jgi:hypothetical protein
VPRSRGIGAMDRGNEQCSALSNDSRIRRTHG